MTLRRKLFAIIFVLHEFRACMGFLNTQHQQRTIVSRSSYVHSSRASSKQQDFVLFSEPSGLYRKFSDHAWSRLQESGMFADASIPLELTNNKAPAKGMKDAEVKITTRAMVPSSKKDGNIVKYARVALLETISQDDGSSGSIQTSGIQVLNFVVIPSDQTNLPVLGIDLVTLPGNRNLILLDAQPMTASNPYEEHWKDWHANHVLGTKKFPWGGDFPEPVQQYVSKYALWTRFVDSEGESAAADPIDIINNDLWEAFTSHLDLYLDLLQNSNDQEIKGPNHQSSYMEYRRSTDPAKPMLNSLYGEEWTNKLLDQVLFPPSS